ncbi:hypothetical protein [Archangium sp.]|uniref:hypothetical protein n=1 Tax=Archangium sp. TaxID=1872627 RepID=UPI00286CA354|nr:hypothetical protein [Archangium sp.]
MEPPDSNSPPSLSELVARVRSPDAGIAEVDALLRGLDQPPRPGEDADERAELLQRILDDPFLRSLTGSDGRRVHAVAARALVALGPPYSLELDPEHLAAMRPARRAASRPSGNHDEALEPPLEAQESPPVEKSPWQTVGLVLVITAGAVEVLLWLFILGGMQGLTVPLLIAVLLSVGTTFAPAVVATSEEGIRNRVLHSICFVLVVLPCLPIAMLIGIAILLGLWRDLSIWLVVPVLLMLARLLGALFLYEGPKAPPPQQ